MKNTRSGPGPMELRDRMPLNSPAMRRSPTRSWILRVSLVLNSILIENRAWTYTFRD
jgi:hypothetical protein